MLAQTNLQLYAQLTACGWPSADLARARVAYDLARQLFGDSYRPTHKPFVSHLVGVASALTQWGAPPPVVLAGLLHSAYLFGRFDDGERGASPRRRRYLQSLLGAEAEAIVLRYTRSGQGLPHTELPDEVQWLLLADLLDELTDAGPLYAPQKGISLQLADPAYRRTVLADALRVVGPVAAQAFLEAFAACDDASVDPALITPDQAYHRLAPGCDGLKRQPLEKALVRATERILRRNAA